jgi:hypothetical protein
MGAWGADSFENDDAADWVADFCEAPDQVVIVNALSAIAGADSDEYLEAADCSVGIATAEVDAALKQEPNPNLPEDTRSCLSKLNFNADRNLVALALKAIERIKTNSELKELWDESETPDEWYQALSSLEGRLNR